MLNGKTVIKMIGNKYGDVSLVQLDSDEFCVRTSEYTKDGEAVKFSASFKDYNMANWLFDIKIEELEGKF
jgi:hypothetical protein